MKLADSPSPLDPAHRTEAIDVARGIALFGVLLMNLAWFDFPHLWGTMDTAFHWLTLMLARGKAWALLSFLFGLGFGMQARRLHARGARVLPIQLRRLLALMVIGFLHSLLFDGDVLSRYAAAALFLLPFRRRSTRTILIAACICYLIPLGQFALGVRVAEPGLAPPTTVQQSDVGLAEQHALNEERREQDLVSHGSLAEVARAHAEKFEARYFGRYSFWLYLELLGSYFPLFLLGLYAERRRLLEDIAGNVQLIRRVMWWGLGAGLAMTAIYVAERVMGNTESSGWAGWLGSLFRNMSSMPFGLCLAAAIILILRDEQWRQRLRPLAAAGRMCLSNYLFSSLLFTTLFYGYGLGLHGRIDPPTGLMLAVVLFVVLIILSTWWLRCFRFGPMEWLLRAFTYGSAPGT